MLIYTFYIDFGSLFPFNIDFGSLFPLHKHAYFKWLYACNSSIDLGVLSNVEKGIAQSNSWPSSLQKCTIFEVKICISYFFKLIVP